MKIIGLDVGTKRIGVSRADSAVRIAVPQCTISVDGTEFDQIIRLARVYDTKFFVIGLPRNLSGEETEQSRYTRDFAKKLKKALPEAKICFQDESLTSVEAEKNLKTCKKGFKKGDIDAEAATIILQDFLENFSNRGEGGTNSLEKKRSNVLKDRFSQKTSIMIVIIVLVAGFFSFIVCCIYNGSLAPVAAGIDCSTEELIAKEPDACKSRSVVVSEGMSISDIASVLKDRGLIQSTLSFRIHAHLHSGSTGLKAGRYDLNRTMSTPEIVAAMVDGSAGVVVFRLTTLPGGTLADFKKTLLENGYSEDEIDFAFSTTYDHPLLASKPATASLEGYIYGETIEFAQGDSVESIIKTLLDEFYNVIVANNFTEKFAAQGLSLHEGIILASIIQKEANAADMPTVASVFYNRLRNDIPLGSDVTVSYAVNLIDPDRRVYTDNSAAISIDSCYNTRRYAGLPCGPISNPGLSALKAVANPAETSYLYFLTGDDGKMYYSDTDSGHQANIRDHCQELCNVSL